MGHSSMGARRATTPRAGALLAAALSTALSSASGCSPRADLVDLRDGEPWASAVVLRGPVSAPSAEAFALDDSPRAIELRPGDPADTTLVLFFRLPLPALLLAEGPLTAATGQVGRHLPRPQRALSIDLSRSPPAAAPVDRTETVQDSDLFRAFLLPSPSPTACVEAGGCYPSGAEVECTLPCPEPTSPVSPAPAELPSFDHCGSWPTRDAASLGITAPELQSFAACVPDPVACAPGQIWTPDEGCRPVVEPCDGWADALPSDAVFVRAGASLGDGSAAAPFGQLFDAFAVIAGRIGRPVIALGPGRYVASLDLNRDIAITGCGAELAGGIMISAGTAQLSNLQITLDHALRVEEGAGLELSRASVSKVSSGPGIGVSIAGTATIARAALEVPFSVTGRGRLSIAESQVGGDGSSFGVMNRAQLSVRDTSFRSGLRVGGVIADDASLVLRRTSLESWNLQFSGRAQGDLTEVALFASTLAASGSAQLRVRQLALIDGQAGLREAAGLSGTDVVFVRTRMPSEVEGDAVLDLQRFLTVGAELWVSDRTRVSLSDASFVQCVECFWALNSSRISLRRAQVLDAGRRGLVVDTLAAERSVVVDVTVKRAEVDGIVFSNPIFLGGSGARSTALLERILVADGGGVGLWLSQGVDVEARDVFVSNIVPADPGPCGEAVRIHAVAVCEGTGLQLGSASAGALTAFEIRGSTQGIFAGAPSFGLSSGRVEDCETGLLLADPNVKPERLLDGVILMDNQVAIQAPR